MTSFAYVAFTIVACVLGLGVGLLLHFLRKRALSFSSTDLSEAAILAERPWEFVSDAQRDANRSFAFHLGTCGAAPAVVAMVAWSNRSDVVTGVCHGLQQLSVFSPLCS